uniref:GIT2 n=3 Tax=Schistosoma mansoni TaxID=6183 RepID=G4VEY7_SCHMA
MHMELLVEMHSNLSAAHFNERCAKQCMKVGNIEGAIYYYKKSIAFMELTREEVEEGDHDYVIIDLQLSSLKLSLSEVVSKKTEIISGDQNISLKTIPDDHSPYDKKIADPPSYLPLSSNQTSNKKEQGAAVKLPKTEFQTREELVTCIEELRKLVDMLASQLSRVRQMLSEERERRLAIEAELISSGGFNYQSNESLTYQNYDDDDGFDENRPCVLTGLTKLTCLNFNTDLPSSAEADSSNEDSTLHEPR